MIEVRCYNRGCGKTFIPPLPGEEDKREKNCLFHPGAPFFHDAYKGWTCCNKKSTDFTEFLNFPGCTEGYCSNVKPKEPENITGNLTKVSESEINAAEQPTRKPIVEPKSRPDFARTPLERIEPVITASLKNQLDKTPLKKEVQQEDDGVIAIGEPCKNGGCRECYSGDPIKDNSECIYHPGVPIFHEGMKFWSCCQKRTSDFQAFLNQTGCTRGKHKWLKDKTGSGAQKIDCRYDWHQTAGKVTLAIYCKRFDPSESYVSVSSVRARIHIHFPEQPGDFDLDLELRGIIDSPSTKVTMAATKIEIVMSKAEAGSWSKIGENRYQEQQENDDGPKVEEEEVPKVDALDLDDLEVSNATMRLSAEAMGHKS